MRTILIIFVLTVACGVGLGFYRGWISLSSGSDSSQSSVTVTVDKDTIEADKDKAMGEARGLGENAEDAGASTTERDQD